MALHTTVWRPDTCGCIFRYEWDTDTLEDNRIHKLVEATKCDIHKDETDKHAFLHVLKENRSVQAGLSALKKVARLTEEKVQEDGSTTTELKPNVKNITVFMGTGKDRRAQQQVVGANLTPSEKALVAQETKAYMEKVLTKDLPPEDAALMETLADAKNPPIDLL